MSVGSSSKTSLATLSPRLSASSVNPSEQNTLVLEPGCFKLYNYLALGPHRLTARTHGSHPCNGGSIPPGAAKKNAHHLWWAFFFTTHCGNRTGRSELAAIR